MKDIGEMDRRVTIYKRTITYGTDGGEINTWALHSTVWAKYEPFGGDEPLSDGSIRAESQAKFTIRYDSAITADMVVVYDPKNIETGDDVWNIERVDQDGRQDKLILYCTHKIISVK